MKTKENNKKYCFDIIYEWEDIIGQVLEKEVCVRSNFEFNFDEKCRKIYMKTHIPIYKLFRIIDIKRPKGVFMFDAATKRQEGIYNSKKYIPCLIDYFLGEDQYRLFINAYKNNPFVLVSSKEVYDYLLRKQCPIKIYHFPLSLPDYYIDFSNKFEKKYDLVLFARQNPMLMKYIDEYENRHEDFSLVRRKYENGHYIYYLSRTGKFISYGDTREEYWNLVKQSKVAVYTTPGMDNTRLDANGWNQVTPHFLEEIAGQCHIIARYPKNADTEWYEMDKMCQCVKNYEEFEILMNKYRDATINIEKYKKYLEKHVTSKRAELLKEIMLEEGIF
ncbi:MAG: hypothetical protein J6J79_00365 [Lachnospiraceae bacterium]|nr:hypothetical protein [Lachnospiraceae bacterium]